MVKFGIMTISYKRPQVLKLFLSSIKRLKMDIGVDFPCVVVGDEDHKIMCEEYNVCHISMANHPATRKWNRAVDYLMGQECEYIVITGSDDIMSTDLLKKLITEMEKGYDLIGIKTIYFYCAEGKQNGQMRRLVSTNILGVARTIKRSIIEKTGVIWDKDSSWGMDSICAKNIARYVRTLKVIDGVIVDVKTSDSLNKFSMWDGRLGGAASPKIFFDIMGEEEKEILQTI